MKTLITMTILELLPHLDAVWHVRDSVDLKTEKLNVKKVVEELLTDGTTPSEAHEEIVTSMPDFGIGKPRTRDFEQAIEDSNQSKQITLDDLIQSQLTALEFENIDDYVALCLRLALAFDIDTDDSETTPEYWEQAYCDDLRPIEAALNSQ
jgi:hypothetical protein